MGGVVYWGQCSVAESMVEQQWKLRVEDVFKRFPKDTGILEVLNGVSIAARPKEIVSVIGPSGSGKSTLFNIISGLIRPDRGRIYIDGAIVPDGGGLVAYMQQKDLLLPWRTVLSNTLLGPEIEGTSINEARSMALELLGRFGLSGFANVYPGQLSGGMRQRAALVRTLLFRKDLVLLDEPFGALDAMTRSVMHAFVLDAWKEFGLTVLFITHDVEEALLVADQVVVLTARPATVKAVIPVLLPRPRRVTDQGFVELKKHLLDLLHGELMGAFSYDA